MSRLLTEAEQKMILDKVKAMQEQKRKIKYDDLLTNVPVGQEQFYQELVDLFLEKDGLNDRRDEIENGLFLQYVPMNETAPLTEDRAEAVAKKLIDMGYIKKLDLAAKFSTEARDEGQIDIIADEQKAAAGKAKKKASIVAKAKSLKKVFEEKISFVDKEIAQIEKRIEVLEKQKENLDKQILDLSAPQAIQTTSSISSGDKTITTNSDSPEQIAAKTKALEARRAKINKEIESLTTKRDEKVAEKEALKLQFEAIVSRINDELAKKGLTLDENGKDSSEASKGVDQEKDAKEDSTQLGPGGTKKTNVEKERRKQTRNKARDVMYGINESLTKEEILEHVQKGRLDHFVEAKRKLGSTRDVKIFDEKLSQLLESMASKDDTLVRNGKIEVGGKSIKLNSSLNAEQMEAISDELDTLFAKKELTGEERKKLDYMQILILLNMKNLSLARLIPGKRADAIRREDLAMKIGHMARARAKKEIKDREFLNEVLVARGDKALPLDRDSDPTQVRYDRSDDLMERVGTSSDYEGR